MPRQDPTPVTIGDDCLIGPLISWCKPPTPRTKGHNHFSDPMIVCGKWFFTKPDIQDPADSEASGQESIAPETDADGNQCLAPSTG